MLITENTFVISDTHFCDSAAVANGFEDYIISNWNKTVSENDTVLHLGDFTSGDGMFNMERKIEKYSKLLNGRIILIKGNHDTARSFTYDKNTIDFLTNIELSQKSKTTEEDISFLSDEITETWWKANKNRLVDEA